jgi:polysaccharide export outer membrane protein
MADDDVTTAMGSRIIRDFIDEQWLRARDRTWIVRNDGSDTQPVTHEVQQRGQLPGGNHECPAAPAFARSKMSVRVKRFVVGTLGLVTCAGGLAFAQDHGAKPAPRGSLPSSGYVIGPGDVLKVTVWKEPDLTLDVTVRIDGKITVPLLGDVQAAGRVPSQLAGALVTELGRFIENPRVTVSVSQATSARFYVVGQMMRPGEFPLSGQMTVLKALALAGGFKEFAKPESIVIVREDQRVIPFNYKHIAEGKDMSQNVLLAAGDTIVVP